MHFPAIYRMQYFDIFCPSNSTMVHIWAKLKLVKFCRIFSRYNFEKLIRTLFMHITLYMKKFMRRALRFLICKNFWERDLCINCIKQKLSCYIFAEKITVWKRCFKAEGYYPTKVGHLPNLRNNSFSIFLFQEHDVHQKLCSAFVSLSNLFRILYHNIFSKFSQKFWNLKYPHLTLNINPSLKVTTVFSNSYSNVID